MTYVGKTLVILNLVAALLVGGFLVFDYATRSNWSHVAENAFQQVTAARSHNSEVEGQAQEVKTQLNALQTERTKLREDLDQFKKKYRKDLKDQQDKTKEAEDNATESAKVAKAAKDEARRLRAEVTKHIKGIEERDATIVKNVDEIRRLLGRAVTAENNVHSLQTRLEALVETLEGKEKQIAKLKSGPVTTAKRGGRRARDAKNPPPAYVRGVVTGVNRTHGLVEVSLGSDEGVNKDNTLEVYRLKPKPQYLGTLVVLEAKEHKSIGKLLRTSAAARRSPIAKGDEVASDVMDR
jgi:hypothetical protein